MIRTIIICSAALLLSVEAWAIGYEFRQGKGLELSWQTDDRVGVTTGNVSYGEMEQLSFWTSSKEQASRQDRSLYAVGYQLKPATTYYSYSPYRWASVFDAHNIQCRYDQQKQEGNGSTFGLASCDYQMAKATTSSTDCTFHYRHIGGVLRISFPAPSAMTIAALCITTETPTLATVAVMDIIDQKVTLGGYSTALTLTTENLNVTKAEEVTLYLAMPAQDLSSTNICISVRDDGGNITPLGSFLGPNVKAGRLYDVNLNHKKQAPVAGRTDVAKVMPEATASGIANPLARTEDFLLDEEYICAVSTPKAETPTHDNDYYNLLGVKAVAPIKGNVYIHQGKKILKH